MRDIRTVGIIGGGLSGLSAGVYLARKGLHVRLFEANNKLGGCCSTTNLQGYTCNNGAMYVAVPEILDHALERLGLDRGSEIPLRQIVSSQETTLPDGSVVHFGRGRDVRILGIGADARQTRLIEELDALLRKWEPVLHLFARDLIPHPFSIARLLWRAARHLPKFRGTVAAELNRLFSDPAVRAAMSGVMLYTGLPPERTPVYQILGLVALFVDGFYLPEGGMGAIPSVLARTLAKHGGEIHTDAKVERIELRNEEVAGLKLEGGDSVPLDAVVSTGGGMLSFTALIDAGCLPRSVAQKVRKTPLSHKAVCVQLGLSNRIDAASHSISRLPLMEDQYKVFVPGDGPPEWFNYTVPTVTMPELAPAGGSIIEMFPPIDQSRPIDRWDEEAKESVAQAAIASLSKIHRMDVAVQRVVSPRDYRDTMHLFGGAVYGISPAADPRAQFPHQTPIAGLFLAGQTTYPGYGVGPAMLSGILAAEALMKSARA